MKITFGAALIGATLLVGCSSSSKETRTDSSQAAVSGSSASAQTQSSSSAGSDSVRGSTAERAADVPAGTAPGAPSAPAVSGAPAQRDSDSARGSAADRAADVPAGTGRNAPVSPGVSAPARSGSESARGSPADLAADVPAGTAGNAPYSPGVREGSLGTADSKVRWANGRLARIDRDGKTITVERTRDSRTITLMVDDRTQIVDRSGSMASSLSSLQEGQEVRAAFDPASHHADRIEVMPKSAPAEQK